MFTFMEDDGRAVQDTEYFNFDHAKNQILQKSPEEISRRASVEFDRENSCFRFQSLGQDITVSYPECRASFTVNKKTPIVTWHFPILHYLATADGCALSGELTSFAHIEKYVAHPQQFESDTGGRLLKLLDTIPLEKLKQACFAFNGEMMQSNADLYVKFSFTPKVDIFLKLWLADDEMPGSAKLLFDKNCARYLQSIDINFAGPLLAGFLVKHCNFSA